MSDYKKITVSSSSEDMKKAIASLQKEGYDINAMMKRASPVVHGWIEGHQKARASRVEFSLDPSLLSLTQGWLEGEGDPISKETFDLAQEALRAACSCGTPEPYVYPTLEGGVQAEWSGEGIEVSVTFSPVSSIGHGSVVAVSAREMEDVEWDVATSEGVERMTKFIDSCLNGTLLEETAQEPL